MKIIFAMGKHLREGNRKCVAAVRHYSYHDEPQI